MKPLYVKKNGVVYRVSGTGIPSIYPAANVEYDNTVTSELQATDVQSAIDELSTRQGGVQSDWDEDDNTELDFIKNKPENLVQDASYVHTDNNYDATAKGKVDSLGTASTKDAGVANGVAELDAAGKVPSSQLPSFVDDVIEVADYDHLPITGESGKIYVTIDTNKSYRWTGSGYAEISESLALGETSSTAYRGDRGKTAYDHATETKLSTATASGLYKVAATAQGHISSLTAVQKSDITALGIPGQDTIIKNTAYGTCDTAGDVKDKVATLSNATNWVLEVGTIVGVRFTYTNTYTPSSGNAVTLNVNNTGAKNIRYGDGVGTGTGDIKNPTAYGEAGQTIYYMYDGTYWVWVSHSKDNDTLYNFVGREFRSCNFNDAGLATGFGGDANLMVVNGVYYYNSNGPSTSIGASADDGSVFVHTCDDGYVVQIAQNYETGNIFVRAMNDNVWSAWKKPDASTVNGLTVQTAVPANAVFTDTNTTYTFAGGTNKITVTPSGGTAQDVNITASDSTKVAKAGDSMSGTLCINSASSGSFTEGLRINAGNGGYSTLLIGGTANSTSGTSAGAFWIGTNTTNASYKRKLYIGQNGSTQSTTYFGTDADATITPYLNLGSSGAVANGDTKAVTGGVVYNYAYPKADVGKSTMAVGKESSRSTATVGTWTAMCNSSQSGSPTLPIAGKWWNVVSLNNWTDSSTNWVSQLAVATQDTLNGVWWRTNDASGTSIDSSTWHQIADGSKIGWGRYGYTSTTTKLKINIKPTIGWMLSFVVTIYQSYIARKFMISGYNYGANHWYSPTAVLLGSSNNTSASVYFGYDSNNNLWVGFDGGNYTGVVISDVCNGYTQLSELGDMFTISNVSSLTTLQTTVTATKPDAATVNGLTLSLVT